MPPKTWAGKRSERFSVVEKGVGIEMQSTRNLFPIVGMDFQLQKAVYIFSAPKLLHDTVESSDQKSV